jgi:hypothetical protein
LILSSSDSPKQILARRVSLLQKKDLQKRERERREGARIKSKKIIIHQDKGMKSSMKKKRMKITREVGETF